MRNRLAHFFVLAITFSGCGSQDAITFPDVDPNVDVTEQEGMAGASCSMPTLSVDTPSPASAGTPVTFTASSSCTGGSAEYLYALRAPGQGYFGQTSYSTDPTWMLDTTGLAAGEYGVLVFARLVGEAHSNAAWMAMAYSIVSVGQPVCTLSSFSISPASPQQVGQTLTLSAAATCTNGGTPEFAFLQREGSNAIDTLRTHSTTDNYEWATNGVNAGEHILYVFVRAEGNAGSADGGLNQGWMARYFTLESASSLVFDNFESSSGLWTIQPTSVNNQPLTASGAIEHISSLNSMGLNMQMQVVCDEVSASRSVTVPSWATALEFYIDGSFTAPSSSLVVFDLHDQTNWYRANLLPDQTTFPTTKKLCVPPAFLNTTTTFYLRATSGGGCGAYPQPAQVVLDNVAWTADASGCQSMGNMNWF